MASRPQLGFKSRIFRNRYLQLFSAVGAKASLRAAADGPLEGAVKPKDPALPAGFAQSPAVLFCLQVVTPVLEPPGLPGLTLRLPPLAGPDSRSPFLVSSSPFLNVRL